MIELVGKILERARRAAFAVLLLMLAVLALGPRPAFADIKYFYDEIGRLVQVVDHSGDSAQYVYDPAGNIVQIVRVTAGAVSVGGFVPTRGPVGTAVTVYGSGFSATPANNTVQFNGTAATVTSSSANQLVATVPVGATTGTISVTVGANTATSAGVFTVTTGAVGAAPTISGFSPGGGAAGTAVTVTGTNFESTPINNTLRFNNTQATIATAASTQLDTTVPADAGSGRISVRTPYGSAASVDDFIVPPPGTAYADIISQVRVAVDGPSGSLSVGTANKHGIVLFDAAPSDWLSLQISTLTVTPSGTVTYRVIDPRNVQVAAGTVSNTAKSIHLPALTVAGTYSILFSPGAATASLTFQLTRNPVLTTAQPTANTPIAVVGQTVRAVYTGSAGSHVAFRMGITSATPTDGLVTMVLLKEGLQIASAFGDFNGGGAIVLGSPLLANGTYFIQLTPASGVTGSLSVTLATAMDLDIDGPSLPVSTNTAGMGKRLIFFSSSAQMISVGFSGLTYAPANGAGTYVTVYGPNGTTVNTFSNSCGASQPNGSCSNAPVFNLPSAGIYQIQIIPPNQVTFNATVTLSTPVSGSLAPATPFAMNTARAGQQGALGFTGTAGQPVNLRLAVASTAPADQNVTVDLYGPTGLVGSATGSPSSDGTLLSVPSLPASGGYGVIVTPRFSSSGSMTLTLNPAMDLAIDGAPLAVSTSTAGHDRRVFFSGTAAQQIGVGLTGLTYSPSSGAPTSVTIYGPNGAAVWDGTTSNCLPSNPNGGCANANLINLPSTGIYQAVIHAPSSVTFSGTLTLSTPIYVPLTAGTPAAATITRAGQIVVPYFNGTSGQPVVLRLAALATTPANQDVSLQFVGPTGQVGSTMIGSESTDGIGFTVTSLPATGGYAGIVIPKHGATGSMTITLNPIDLAIDGAPLAVSTSAAGHDKRVFFSGTAAQQIGVGLTGLTYSSSSGTPTTVMLYGPNGAAVGGGQVSNCLPSNPNGGCATANLINLPGTGTYQAVIDGPSGVTFSGTLTLSTPIYVPLTAGTPATATITRGGQHVVPYFDGTAGQPATLRLAAPATTPANQDVSMDLYGPTGQIGSTMIGSAATDGITFTVGSLPATGGYAAVLVPKHGATGSLTVTLNPAP
jgi:large repetitive protein